jgi:multimeric flavodoxin WrbA
MRAVLLAEVPIGDVFTAGTSAVVADELTMRGYAVGYDDVTKLDIIACVGCFDCWTTTPGRCRFRDDGDRLLRRVVNADLLVLVGPVTFGGYGARIKRAVDRMLPILSPMLARQDGEVYRRARYRRMPSLVALGTQPAADAEAAHVFRTVAERNALHLHAPSFGIAVLEASMPTTEVRLAVQAALAAVDHGSARPRPRSSGPVVGVRP